MCDPDRRIFPHNYLEITIIAHDDTTSALVIDKEILLTIYFSSANCYQSSPTESNSVLWSKDSEGYGRKASIGTCRGRESSPVREKQRRQAEALRPQCLPGHEDFPAVLSWLLG